MKKSLIPIIAGLIIGLVASNGRTDVALGLIGMAVVANALTLIEYAESIDDKLNNKQISSIPFMVGKVSEEERREMRK